VATTIMPPPKKTSQTAARRRLPWSRRSSSGRTMVLPTLRTRRNWRNARCCPPGAPNTKVVYGRIGRFGMVDLCMFPAPPSQCRCRSHEELSPEEPDRRKITAYGPSTWERSCSLGSDQPVRIRCGVERLRVSSLYRCDKINFFGRYLPTSGDEDRSHDERSPEAPGRR
jgi:hypothetical protein